MHTNNVKTECSRICSKKSKRALNLTRKLSAKPGVQARSKGWNDSTRSKNYNLGKCAKIAEKPCRLSFVHKADSIENFPYSDFSTLSAFIPDQSRLKCSRSFLWESRSCLVRSASKQFLTNQLRRLYELVGQYELANVNNRKSPPPQKNEKTKVKPN